MAITLLDMLLNAGLINRDQFEEALHNRVLYGGKIGTSLIELGYISEEELARFLSEKLSVPYVNPEQLLNVPPAIINLLPRELALKYGVIPLSLERKRLSLVMADPADLTAVDEISFITGYSIRPLITPEVRLIQALGIYYQTSVDSRFKKVIDRIESEQIDLIEPLEEVSPPKDLYESILDEVKTVEVADWRDRVRLFTPSELSKGLARSDSREEIADLVIAYMAGRFERAAIFMIRNNVANGWKGVLNQEPIIEITDICIPLSEPSVLKTVADSAGLYLGPLTDTPANMRLLDGMGGGRPKSVLLAPLMISGRIIIILYADSEYDMNEKVPELQKLLRKTALAFEALICREKILML
jgi:hypothetical protein